MDGVGVRPGREASRAWHRGGRKEERNGRQEAEKARGSFEDCE